MFLDAIAWVLLAAGGFFSIVGALGLVRMPDFFTRVHAASVTDTLGMGLIVLGLVLMAGFTLVAVKLLMLAVMVFFVSPTTTHALVKAATLRGLRPLLAPEGKDEPWKP